MFSVGHRSSQVAGGHDPACTFSITCLNFKGKQVTTQQQMVYDDNRVIRKVTKRQLSLVINKQGEILKKPEKEYILERKTG